MKQQEHIEQSLLFAWAAAQAKHPELRLMFAIPNGGARHIAVARKLKAEGVKAGVPDIFLPVARGPYHGCFIEMKSEKGRATESQKVWLADLQRQLYYAKVCRGFEEAVDTLTTYLDLEL